MVENLKTFGVGLVALLLVALVSSVILWLCHHFSWFANVFAGSILTILGFILAFTLGYLIRTF